MMLNGFDRVAWFYDSLVRLVYGKSIVNAQITFLHQIPSKAKVLVLGGGTGWILEEILAAQPDCEIVFIDASANMIKRAKKRPRGSNEVTFIHGTEEHIGLDNFDVVITPFFLDMFSDKHLSLVVQKIGERLHREAVWLVSDFIGKDRFWQRALLRIMYAFFRMLTSMEAKALPAWNLALTTGGWRKVDSKRFYRGFIEAAFYRRARSAQTSLPVDR